MTCYRSLPGILLGLVLLGALPAARGQSEPSAEAADEANAELIQMVVGLLQDEDQDLRALGLEQVRMEAKGTVATKEFAALLPKLPADAQVGLLRALAERGDTYARPGVLERMTGSADAAVQVAAIEALGKLGEPADVTLLLELLRGSSAEKQAAARTSLTRMAGERVSPLIVTDMTTATPAQRVILIEILAQRRALDTIPVILTAALDNEPTVRAAAMIALGQLAGPEHLPGMIQGVLRAEEGRERVAAEKAVMFVCNRLTNEAARTATLLAAINGLKPEERREILPTLGRVGGPAALSIVESAIGAADEVEHEAGIRALCSWPDASVADRLVELYKADPHAEHRTMALRALIRVAPLPDGRSDAEKLGRIEQAMELCTDDAERNLVLQRASAIRTMDTLRYLIRYIEQPAYAQQACQSIVELAHHRDLRQPNKEEFDQVLDQVIQISQDATVIDRAHRYKKGQTWVRPKTPARNR